MATYETESLQMQRFYTLLYTSLISKHIFHRAFNPLLDREKW